MIPNLVKLAYYCMVNIQLMVLFFFPVLCRRVRGVLHAFVKIFSEGGIRGLWAGWVPNVQRAALVNLGGLYL